MLCFLLHHPRNWSPILSLTYHLLDNDAQVPIFNPAFHLDSRLPYLANYLSSRSLRFLPQKCSIRVIFISGNETTIDPVNQVKNLSISLDASLLSTTCNLAASLINSLCQVYPETAHFSPLPRLFPGLIIPLLLIS